MFLFSCGLIQGHPHRILYGTDVSGDLCGQVNLRVEGVEESGKDLTNKRSVAQFCGVLMILPSLFRLLYFDLWKTASIAGDSASNLTVQFEDSQMSAREFCLRDEEQQESESGKRRKREVKDGKEYLDGKEGEMRGFLMSSRQEFI